jgi:hypothetical protein
MPILPFREHMLMWLRSYQNSLEVISNSLSPLPAEGPRETGFARLAG